MKHKPDVLGTSVFVPVQPSLIAMQRAGKRAILECRKAQQFRVCGELFCTEDEIDALLEAAAGGADILPGHRAQMSGAFDQTLNCMMLADSQAGRGVFLHRQKGGYIAACLPVLSMEEAEADYSLALELAMLAERAENMYVNLPQGISGGERNLKELLRMLALQVDPLSTQ